MAKLTPAQRRVLEDLARGAWLFESGSRVWLCSTGRADRLLAPNTVRALRRHGWIAEWVKEEGTDGLPRWRMERITSAGRRALEGGGRRDVSEHMGLSD